MDPTTLSSSTARSRSWRPRFCRNWRQAVRLVTIERDDRVSRAMLYERIGYRHDQMAAFRRLGDRCCRGFERKPRICFLKRRPRRRPVAIESRSAPILLMTALSRRIGGRDDRAEFHGPRVPICSGAQYRRYPGAPSQDPLWSRPSAPYCCAVAAPRHPPRRSRRRSPRPMPTIPRSIRRGRRRAPTTRAFRSRARAAPRSSSSARRPARRTLRGHRRPETPDSSIGLRSRRTSSPASASRTPSGSPRPACWRAGSSCATPCRTSSSMRRRPTWTCSATPPSSTSGARTSSSSTSRCAPRTSASMSARIPAPTWRRRVRGCPGARPA